jgi:hypothetical protein
MSSGVVRIVALIAVLSFAAACVPDPPPSDTAVISVGGEPIHLSVAEGLGVTVVPVDLTSLPPTPAVGDFSLGALQIKVSGVPSGTVARVTIALETPIAHVRKLVAGTWDEFTHDGTTGTIISADGTTVTLDLLDGGRGDSDGVANGTISDPVALAYQPWPTTCISLPLLAPPNDDFRTSLRIVGPPNTAGNIAHYFTPAADPPCDGQPIAFGTAIRSNPISVASGVALAICKFVDPLGGIVTVWPPHPNLSAYFPADFHFCSTVSGE